MSTQVTNYVAPPTIARMMQSDARMRLVMGPVGCTDADTEFLTPQGWKRIADYKPGDLVLQWHESGDAEFVEPLDYITAPNPDGFWHFTTTHTLDMMLTPNHRMPLYQWDGKFVVKTAQRVAVKPSRHRVPTSFTCSNGLPLTDTDIRLRVMIAADGSYPAAGNQCVVTVRRERKKERVRSLLADAGIEYVERVYPRRPTETQFVFQRPDFPKHLEKSADWYRASSRQLEVLLEEVLHWDGLHNHEELRFTTARKPEADIVQFAAHACGRVAHIRKQEYENENWVPIYTVQWSNADSARGNVRLRGDSVDIAWVPDEGRSQYCFTVPSTFWVARRNGRIFITGNSGKSVGCMMEIARRAAMQAPGKDGIRRTRWAAVRATAPQLRDSTIKTFFQWFPPGVAGTWKETNMTFTMRFGDVEAEVLFRALDEPEDIRRLLSLELTGFYANEVQTLDQTVISALLSRCGRYPSKKDGGPTWYGGVMDANPPSTDHWIYEKFEVEKPRGWEIFRQPGGLDPNAENVENLPESYYQDMMEGADPEWVRSHVHAQYSRSKQGMPVYNSSWRTDFHTRSNLQVLTSSVVVIGLDAGRTPAAAFFQMDAKGRVLMLDEVTSENMGMENFLRQRVKPLLLSRYAGIPAVVSADPAVWQKSQLNEKSVADIIREAGLTLPKPRGPAMGNRIEPRIRAVESLLNRQIDGEAAFLVDKDRCPQAVAGFEHGYRFKRKKDGQYEETPEKNEHSHLADAIQYGCQLVEYGGDYATSWQPRARQVEAVSMAGWT